MRRLHFCRNCSKPETAKFANPRLQVLPNDKYPLLSISGWHFKLKMNSKYRSLTNFQQTIFLVACAKVVYLLPKDYIRFLSRLSSIAIRLKISSWIMVSLMQKFNKCH